MKTIDYYFTPSSPWTYLGHQRLVEIAARHGAGVRVLPVDLGGQIFPGSGGLPLPKRAPQRQAYRLVELRRWADHVGLPLNLQPKYFPSAGSDAARLVILADEQAGVDTAMKLAHLMMRGLWAEERDIADAATLVEMADACGLPGGQLMAGLSRADARFASNTREAMQAQVFGAPWYVYRGEPFWGQDRLDFLERALTHAV
jgi:2-hydroxychromene-2-carboxylate isomerase